jgi:hypothetical protein
MEEEVWDLGNGMTMRVVSNDKVAPELFKVMDAALSPSEALAAKVAIAQENTKWVGSMDWEGAVTALVMAALNAIADCRNSGA